MEKSLSGVRVGREPREEGFPLTDYSISYLRIKFEIAGGKSISQIRDIYVEAFLAEYRVYLEQEADNGNLPDENTRRIKKKAREDKSLDTRLRKNISPRQIDHQAVIRVYELLRLDTRNETDYLAQIEKFVGAYADEYAHDREVKSAQFERSDRFPGAPNV